MRGTSMRYHASTWPECRHLRHKISGDACKALPAHMYPNMVILRFDNHSSPIPAVQQSKYVLYLLQGTEVIVIITFRSLSVNSLGTTHLVWGMYSCPAEQPLNQSQTVCPLVRHRPSKKDRMTHGRGSDI